MRAGGLIHQPILLALGHDDQPPHVEGCIYRQPLQKAGRVQYQLLRALGRTHFYAAANGGMGFPSLSIMGKGTSSSPIIRGSKILSPLTNVYGSYYTAKEGANVDRSHGVHYQLTADGGCSAAKQGAKVDRSHNVHYQLLMASPLPSHYGRQDVSQPLNVDGSYPGPKEQDVSLATKDNGMLSDVSRDVSPSANADGGCSTAKEGANVGRSHDAHYQLEADGGYSAAKQGAKVDRSHSVHYQLLTAASPSSGHRQQDVSPPTIFGRRSTWSQGGRRRIEEPRNHTTLHCRAALCVAAHTSQFSHVL